MPEPVPRRWGGINSAPPPPCYVRHVFRRPGVPIPAINPIFNPWDAKSYIYFVSGKRTERLSLTPCLICHSGQPADLLSAEEALHLVPSTNAGVSRAAIKMLSSEQIITQLGTCGNSESTAQILVEALALSTGAAIVMPPNVKQEVVYHAVEVSISGKD